MKQITKTFVEGESAAFIDFATKLFLFPQV